MIPSPCISLLTDFGLQDSYVGQMKGAISAINPRANVVDVTHAIVPQQILQGAMVLADAIDAFPAGTIHVIVVDPGVGTSRRSIAAEVGDHRFVCPDNGLLTGVLRQNSFKRAVELDNPRWWRPQVSRTFHGRDLFAPVAAAWSLGRDLSEFGSLIRSPLVEISWPEVDVERSSEGALLKGQVLAIDHFGNLITNVVESDISPEAKCVTIEFAGRRLGNIERCYGDRLPGECLALVGSSERLEVAIVNGNAAHVLKVSVGEPIVIRWN